MNRHMPFLTALLTLASCPTIHGQETPVPYADDGVHVSFKQVIPARSLINQRVEDKFGVEIGTISDIPIDVQFGQVAFVAINSRRAANEPASNYFLPPSVIASWSKDKILNLNVAWEDIEHVGDLIDAVQPSMIDAKRLGKLYKHHHAVPYWGKNHPDIRTLSLITVDELDGRIIRDADWRMLGRIEEILLAPDHGWKVAYLSVGELPGQPASNERIAVPMSAFARRTLSPTWLLNVPKNSELLSETFPAGQWPTSIERGWIEFTHVKYGAATLGGIQGE